MSPWLSMREIILLAIMAFDWKISHLLALCLSGKCSLEHTITLLRVTEPLEDRMEQALFSPPLSKQRVEYALQHIQESHALSMVCACIPFYIKISSNSRFLICNFTSD